MTDEKRIYVVVPAVVEVRDCRTVVQPSGRQIAQACHVAAKLRHESGLTTLPHGHLALPLYQEITTIVLQARDSREVGHILSLAIKKKLDWSTFADENKEVYGDIRPITGLAVYATKKQIEGILDYLPLWGA